MASIGGPTGQQQTLYYGNQESKDYAGAAQASEKPDFPLPQPSAPQAADQPPPYSASLPNPGPLAAPTVVLPSQFFHDGIQDAFFTACETGDLALISQMIAKGADVNAKKIYPPFCEGKKTYREIKSPLMLVSELGNLDAAKMLVAAGALVQVKGALKTQGLLGRYRTYSLLLEEATVLHAACSFLSKQFNPDLVFFLVSAGADVNAQAKSSEPKLLPNLTPLFMLCNKRNNDTSISLFIEHGASPKDCAYVAKAIQTDHSKECIESLLKAGASATHNSPINIAAIKGLIDIAKLLVDHGATINPAQNSPLASAALNNQLSMMAWLLQNGANPSISFEINYSECQDLKDKIKTALGQIHNLKMPLLMYGVSIGNVEMVNLLLNAKADTRTNGTYKKYISPGFFSARVSSYENSYTLSLLKAVSLLTPPEKKEAITKLLRHHGVSEECTIS